MKKTVIIAFAIVMGLFVAGCNSDKKSDVIVDHGVPTTTTTTTDNSAVKAECASVGSDLVDTWTELGNTLQEAEDSGVGAYIVNEAVDAINSGITATRTWISACGSYFPSEAAQLEKFADDMEAAVAELS